MKYFLFSVLLLVITTSYSQEEKKDYGRIYGGFETNTQRYLEYENQEQDNPPTFFRSNNYLLLNYEIQKWTFGLQVESYEKKALLNYSPGFDGTNVALYFAKYKSKKIEATLGYFYEQYGSGMILRAWEDRALGINTALRGFRFAYKPTNDIKFSTFFGQQRSGFKTSNGKLYGFNIDVQLNNWLKLEESDLSIGFSNVNRYEKIDEVKTPNPDFKPTTNAYSFRLNYSKNIFYSSLEINYKSKDGVLNRINNEIIDNLTRSGSAFQWNFGIAKEGLGFDISLRRTENFQFLSERLPQPYDTERSSLDFFDKVINFTPALTKQHHSNLANIYVYQAQAGVEFKTLEIMKSGETGGQVDFIYEFAKNSTLGGKYGTKLAVNYSSWYNLPGTYRSFPEFYETNFFGVGEKYFSDFNIEVKKQMSENFRSSFLYVNQFYNKKWVEDKPVEINTHIAFAEFIYNINQIRSIKLDLEHMWADEDFRNWYGITTEFNFNDKWSVFAMDLVNYGNKDPEEKNKHYLTIGTAYRKGTSRVSVSYGRQRGGLVCVGGVCRFVPESTGFSLSFNTAF